MKIFLIGMMGSGKSTIGMLLAKKLYVRFYDLDSMIETKVKKTIAEIFAQFGETHFRDLESAILQETVKFKGVIACGGGVILKKENRSFMNQTGKTVFLQATIPTLSERLSGGKTRPLLSGKNTDAKLNEIWKKRKMHYLNSADIIVHTDGKIPQTIINEIIAFI